MLVPARRISLPDTSRPPQASAGALLADLPSRRVHSASWFPSQVACLMERLPQALCDYEIVTLHGALVFDVPPPDFAVAPVKDVYVSRGMVARVRHEDEPAGLPNAHAGLLSRMIMVVKPNRRRAEAEHEVGGKSMGAARPWDAFFRCWERSVPGQVRSICRSQVGSLWHLRGIA